MGFIQINCFYKASHGQFNLAVGQLNCANHHTNKLKDGPRFFQHDSGMADGRCHHDGSSHVLQTSGELQLIKYLIISCHVRDSLSKHSNGIFQHTLHLFQALQHVRNIQHVLGKLVCLRHTDIFDQKECRMSQYICPTEFPFLIFGFL